MASCKTEQPVGSEAEIWRTFRDGKYEVSTCGRVRNSHTGGLLKQFLTNKGRLICTPRIDGMRHTMQVASMIAEAFIGTKPPSLQINHINGNRRDNRPENLEYITAKENCDHAHNMGLRANGERSHRAKLKLDQVEKIRGLIADRIPLVRIARMFGVTPNTIGWIKNGGTWSRPILQ